MPQEPGPEQPIHRRIAWFLSLWVGGVAALALVAGIIRWWIH